MVIFPSKATFMDRFASSVLMGECHGEPVYLIYPSLEYVFQCLRLTLRSALSQRRPNQDGIKRT